MSYANNSPGNGLRDRLRAEFGQRATGIGVALLLEIGLLLLLLTLSRSNEPLKEPEEIVAAFDAGSEPEAEPEAEQDKPDDPEAPPTQQEARPVPTPPQPAATPPPILPRRDLPRNFDLGQLPPTPNQKQQNYGPPTPGNLPRDSERVGTMPNGDPLYKAEWYVKPSRQMLGDYLSTAQGPGWGRIACRTEPEWRVVDCVPYGEYPQNSSISRSVLAAAWEFRVRPARLKGRYLYGTWVLIHIDYEVSRSLEYQPPD